MFCLLLAAEELAGEGDGDILVFLPGEREIREHADYLGKKLNTSRRLRGTEVLPLYARLSNAEQNRIFDLAEVEVMEELAMVADLQKPDSRIIKRRRRS